MYVNKRVEKRVSSLYFRRVSIAYVSFYSCNCPGCALSVLFSMHMVVWTLCALLFSHFTTTGNGLVMF